MSAGTSGRSGARGTPVGPWVSVGVIIAGFAAAGVCLITGGWWLLAFCVLVVVGGAIAAVRTGILQDTRTRRLDDPTP
jgi:hypothetical protein